MDYSLTNVPYIPPRRIENDTLELLHAYGRIVGKEIKPPIPVEDIIARCFGYNIRFTSDGMFIDPEFFGGIVIINTEVLLNDVLGNREGQLGFTTGHECGHLKYHVPLVLARRQQIDLFPGSKNIPDILCRQMSQAKKPRAEKQADLFASFLLLPHQFLMNVFKKVCANIAGFNRGSLLTEGEAYKICVEIQEVGNFSNVSIMAIRNRLITMELLPGITYQSNADYHPNRFMLGGGWH